MTYALPNAAGGGPIKIDRFEAPTNVYVQVKDASTCRFSRDRSTLVVAGPAGIAQGLAVVAATGIVRLVWQGDLWAIGNIAGVGSLCDIEILR